MASDGLTAGDDRGNGHGGHQPRHTRHNDGTERMVYLGGASDGTGRWWKLMKRPPNGSWQLEAQGQTNNEAMLFLGPHHRSGARHFVSRGCAAHQLRACVQGGGPFRARRTTRAARTRVSSIGADGTVALVNYYDQLLDGTYSKDCERHWAAAQWNGSAMAWGPVQKKYIGLRRAYNYVMPGAFGNTAEWAGVSLWNGKKEYSAPLVPGPYIWDGVYEERALISDAQSLRLADVTPRRTEPSETQQSFMALQGFVGRQPRSHADAVPR